MRRIVTHILLLIAFVPQAQSQSTEVQKMRYAMQTIASIYVDSISETELVDAAIAGMIKVLDPHSAYFTSDDARESRQDLESEYSGYGMELTIVDDSLTVTRTICNGAADNVGIMPGDRIISMADVPTTGDVLDMRIVKEVLLKNKGFKISCAIVRGDEPIPMIIKLKSGKIEQSTINSAFLINDSIAYVGIRIFGQETDVEFSKEITRLKKKGAKKLILDLRGNNGGYISSAVGVAGQFVEHGTKIVTTSSGLNKEYLTDNGELFLNKPIVVLVDGNSASSSELLAVAIQDLDRGVIVGRPTYGKGLTQRTIHISDGSELLISSGRCYSPIGRCIQREYHIDHSQYRQNAEERLKRPLDFLPDDSSQPFYTLVNRRKMYAHHGVIPDVIVEKDTLGQEFLCDELKKKAIFERIAARTYKFTKGDPRVFSDEIIAERICREAKKYGYVCSVEQILNSPLIIATLKAAIKKQNNCQISIVQHTYRYDSDIIKAIELLQNMCEYEKLLTQTQR